ncbi:MAG: NAD-dependent epimerase/dehydratase family protein [Rhodospirillales bacterium]|nr:NAD-dependent epimerase/dehydratase family protein [Rhodospirillales bacterium]
MLEHLSPSPQSPQRVVVMGARGFIGGAITRRLIATGVPTLALGRSDVDLLAANAWSALAAQLRAGDVFVAVSALAPVKTLEMLQANITMMSAMTRALRAVPIAHVLNIGSDAVFADLPLPLTETSTKEPGSYHGFMHAMREVAFAETGLPLATLRPTLVYGVGDPHDGYGPNRFLRLVRERKDIVLFGEGEERRDHVVLEDVAELACRMILQRSRGSLNCATGDVWSFREVASLATSLVDTPVRIIGSPRQGPMPHNGLRPFDPTATRLAFPDFAYTRLPAGLAKTFAAGRSSSEEPAGSHSKEVTQS